MLQQFELATEETIRSLRGAAELRFKEVIEEPSKQVSEEFESVMQSLEEKRRGNLERAAHLREQLGVVQAQLDSIARYGATVVRSTAAKNAAFLASARDAPRASAELELVHLKQAVRAAWRERDARAGGPAGGAVAQERYIFLLHCLREAKFTPRLHAKLFAQTRALQAGSDRTAADARAVAAAHASYRATAARIAGVAAQLRS